MASLHSRHSFEGIHDKAIQAQDQAQQKMMERAQNGLLQWIKVGPAAAPMNLMP